MTERRRHSPAAGRNAQPLSEALSSALPLAGTVLEIASGSGEHSVYLAWRFPKLRWQPSDVDPEALASIEAHGREAALGNWARPLQLDMTDKTWPQRALPGPFAAILSVNMIHISPWEATVGLLEGAAQLLTQEARLFLYGPFFQQDAPIAPSNIEFDASLRAQDSRWGVRKLEDVLTEARRCGFEMERVLSMPANNLTVQLRRN